MTGKRFALLLALVAIAVGGWKLSGYLKLHGLGLISRIMDPIHSPREVTWDAGPSVPAAPPAGRPPNIVVIVADDLGYNDLTWAGGGVANGAVTTPNIDSIARDGVQFTAGYSGNATCAPSRAAILTGRYPTRFGFEFTPAPKIFMRLVAGMTRDQPGILHAPIYHDERERDVPSMDDEGVPPSEITLAELLRAHGYHTLGFGKWHLGEAPPLRPEAQGFDEYLGFYAGASLYLDADDPRAVNSVQEFDPIDLFLWANLPFAVRKNGGERFRPADYMTDYLGNEAAKAIAANHNRPFFLYFAPNAPHTPLQALRSDYDALSQIADHRLRVYAAMIRALDRAVGRVLDALKANGLEQNTLVFFSSDNGGANYIGLPDINKPYRGWKMTFFEGGMHSPFFLKWPAVVPAGATFSAPVAQIDILPTAAAAAQAPLPADRTIDGVNLVPFVTGHATGPPHQSLFWRSGGYKTVIAGGWKLQVSERPKRDRLYHLDEDPTERVDVSAENPAKVAELKAVLAAYEAGMVKPVWPSLIEASIDVDHPLGVPEHADDEYVYWEN
ncbi:MAG TPA: sulfatase-like hydrolase/transferase [Candidatus Binatia bacterium]|nr:sulfatase-like hydrolase/transferase [Candidatus Binatia bacterium]